MDIVAKKLHGKRVTTNYVNPSELKRLGPKMFKWFTDNDIYPEITNSELVFDTEAEATMFYLSFKGTSLSRYIPMKSDPGFVRQYNDTNGVEAIFRIVLTSRVPPKD